MMEFWAESQGQSPLYAKFGTVPGRNCTHVYHDKHQAAHFQQYLCEQQDQGREPTCWTVPGSRTGGVLQDYSNWTDPELTAPASHFPFVLDSQPRQLQDVGAYRPQPDKREWAAGETHRALRDREVECERRMLREGWQRRWDTCSPPVHYRREAPKRSLTDSSYRELEAWAARYSHSLPRRRRIEAELRGASQPQGLPEGNRVLDSRSGTDPRLAALHRTGLPANMRDLEQWERESRQQTMTHYPTQPPVSDAVYMSDGKGKNAGYHRRMFSHPPGYIAPPPYNSPHNSSPVMHHCDRYPTGWEQEVNRQIYASLPAARRQNAVGLQGERRGEEEFPSEAWRQRICSDDTAEHRQHIPATDHLSTGPPAQPENAEIQRDGLLSAVQPPTEQSTRKTNAKQEKSSNVIEGRKFSFNKKRGGQTIFCLVSRMCGQTGSSSSPPLEPRVTPSPQAHVKSPDSEEASRGLGDCGDVNLVQKFADEVDFNVPPLQIESVASAPKTGSHFKAKLRETQNWMDSEQAAAHREELIEVIQRRVKQREDQANKMEGDGIFASVKYPLWREPGRVKSDGSSPGSSKAEREGESGQGLSSSEGGGQPFDIEVRRLEVKEDTESENSGGLLVIDTTCVIVRVELIPPPIKEHISHRYPSSPPHSDQNPPDVDSIPPTESVESDDKRTPGTTPMESTDTSESKESDQDKVHNVSNAEVTQTEALLWAEEVDQITSPPNYEKETLEERAERILGIALLDDFIPHQTRDASSVDFCAQDQNGEEGETSEMSNDEINDVIQHQTQDAISFLDLCVQDQNEEGETSRLTSDEISDIVGSLSGLVLELPVTKQQASTVSQQDAPECQPETEVEQPLEPGKPEDAACVAESDVTQDQLPKQDNEDVADLLEQACIISEQDALHCQPETEVEQPLECGRSEDAAESDVTQDQLPKEDHEDVADSLEPASTLSKQDALHCQPETVVEQPLELRQDEDAACVAKSDVSQDELLKEDNEDPPDICQMSNIPEQKAIDCQPETEVQSLQEIVDESLFVSCSQQELCQEAKDQACDSDVFPQLPSQSLNAPSDGQKSPSAYDVTPPFSQLTLSSHVPGMTAEPLSCPESPRLPSSANLALNPEALESGTSETIPSSHREPPTPPMQFPSPPPSPSVPLPPPSPSTSHEPSTTHQCLDISDVEHREEPQYPRSLWDAVNRIRKHTAPDSENEEEEVGELWDPESAGEDFASLDVEVGLNAVDPLFCCSEGLLAAAFPLGASGRIKERQTLDEQEQLEVAEGEAVEHVAIGETERDTCHRGWRGHLEDDTLSCSSMNSRGSDDTVVVGDSEGEVEGNVSDSETEDDEEMESEGEIKTDEEEDKSDHCDPVAGEEEGSVSSDDRLTSNTAVEEGGGERNDKLRDTNESGQNHRRPAEVDNTIRQTVVISENGKNFC